MSKQSKLPEFTSESEERAFWESHDSTEYLDWGHAKQAAFPELRPTTKTISLRMPESLLNRIKAEAHKRDMPYQSLIKSWLSDQADQHRQAK